MTWDASKHPRGKDGRFGNTVGAKHLKQHNIGSGDLISVLSTKVKKYAGFTTVADFIEKHPKGKAAALRILAADHKAGKIAFQAVAKKVGVGPGHTIQVLKATTKKYAGHATVGSFIASHPKGKEAAMLTLAADVKAGRIALKAAPAAAGTSDDPISAAGWKKVGSKKGSNPGGTYEAPSGKQFYLKEVKSKEHLENELLANALYKKLGVATLEPKAFKLDDGKLAIGSEIKTVGKFDSNSPAHVALAQKDFAAHAFLANWDATGATYDNLGVIDGKIAQLDAGGALKFRAQGGLKGEKFGGSVGEFDSLRSGVFNQQADKIFGGMTATQIQASAQPVLKLSDKDIDDALKSAVSDPAQRSSLAKVLKARRDDLGQRVETALAKEKAEKAAGLHKDDEARWAKAAGVRTWMNRHPNTEEAGALRSTLKEAGVSFTSNAESAAADYYTHSGYSELNGALRKGEKLSPLMKKHADELDGLVAGSKFAKDTIAYRGFGAAATMQNKAPPPAEHDDKGFVSVSLNPGVARSFSDAKSIYRIRIPKGFPGRAVSIDGDTTDDMIKNEAEIVLPRGTQFRIVKRSKKLAFSNSMDVVDVVAYLPKKKP